MILVNTETVPGRTVLELKGLVQGNTIRAKHLGRDLAASLKNIVGGELKGYTELLTEARRPAVERVIAQAEELGADALVDVRFPTSEVSRGGAGRWCVCGGRGGRRCGLRRLWCSRRCPFNLLAGSAGDTATGLTNLDTTGD